ncbi:MAG: AAA family ATPase [Nitrospiraceae bacterium]|nr:MAG: AAA family ATPase [Nitrospiraceae bacterium]
MYKEYFGLEEMPFSIAPDPRYLYMSEQHREALAHLVFGFNSDGGFVLLTGEVGTGKTTICRCLLDQIPENVSIAFIINPKLTVEELLATICDEFGIQYQKDSKSIKYYVDIINRYLLEAHAKGHKTIVIIDEAQNLSSDVLEQLRLLTNLETNKVKLLQIILLGQPELRDKLSRPELRQLSQRIIARYHLGPLSAKDVSLYVVHRLTIAGVKRQLFTSAAISKLYRSSRGVPRLINVLCDRALLGAFALGKNQVTASILIKASREVFGFSASQVYFRKVSAWTMTASVVIIVGIVFAAGYYNKKSSFEKTTSVVPQHQETKTGPGKENHASLQPAADSGKVEHMNADLLQWTDSLPVNESRGLAFQSLFREWGLEYDPSKHGDACEFAKANGLQCYDQRGNLRILTVLNHPAVLRLVNNKGQEFYVSIAEIQKDNVTVKTGTHSVKVSLKDIESFWLGAYSMFWKAPQHYQGEVKPGDRNILIPWLDKQLASVQNRTYQTRNNTLYDDELVESIKKYQVASGLLPDGIIGPQTLMRLYHEEKDHPPFLIKRAQAIRN